MFGPEISVAILDPDIGIFCQVLLCHQVSFHFRHCFSSINYLALLHATPYKKENILQGLPYLFASRNMVPYTDTQNLGLYLKNIVPLNAFSSSELSIYINHVGDIFNVLFEH